MSKSIDRALDTIDAVLDVGAQHSTEYGYDVRAEDGFCSRCCSRAVAEDSEFCALCRAFLLGDAPDPMAERHRVLLDGWAIDQPDAIATGRELPCSTCGHPYCGQHPSEVLHAGLSVAVPVRFMVLSDAVRFRADWEVHVPRAPQPWQWEEPQPFASPLDALVSLHAEIAVPASMVDQLPGPVRAFGWLDSAFAVLELRSGATDATQGRVVVLGRAVQYLERGPLIVLAGSEREAEQHYRSRGVHRPHVVISQRDDWQRRLRGRDLRGADVIVLPGWLDQPGHVREPVEALLRSRGVRLR